MTITEKILARASGKQKLSPGDVMFAKVDKVMLHDVSGPGVIKVFSEWEKKRGLKLNRIWDPDRVWVAEDHFVPSADRISAENINNLSNFTRQYGINKHFKYGLGQYGICHTLSHEEALVLPGEVYVGGDSHTNTTGAIGAFAACLGHTDIAYVLMKGEIWFKVPETMLFKIRRHQAGPYHGKGHYIKDYWGYWNGWCQLQGDAVCRQYNERPADGRAPDSYQYDYGSRSKERYH